jgi:hypothetical protein
MRVIEMNRSTAIGIQVHENTAGCEKCTMLEFNPQKKSTGKRAPKKSLPTFS